MKAFRYSFVFLICGLVIITTGCKKQHEAVINTNSGIVIHSSDYVKTPKTATTVNGRLVKFGDSSSNDNGGPSFDFDKLQ